MKRVRLTEDEWLWKRTQCAIIAYQIQQRNIWTRDIGRALTMFGEAKGSSVDRRLFELEDLIEKELSRKHGPTGPKRVFGEATAAGIAQLERMLCPTA